MHSSDITHDVILHLGSNVLDKQQNLKIALQLIEQFVGKIRSQSSVYCTAAWGVEDQDEFMNIAVKVDTKLSPFQLIDQTQNIENTLGRIKTQKWGPRLIDIDIIFYDDLILNTERLILPHEFMSVRNFVLVPLAEIDPNRIHPVFFRSVSHLRSICKDQLNVVRYEKF